MRILQLIDSLETGGAERMAVNYANILSQKIELSALIATRAGGGLESQIDSKVVFEILNKKSTIDFKSIKSLYRFCKFNKINWIHAHSSSFFLAVIIKCLLPSIKIVWHDHYGTKSQITRLFKYSLFISKHLFSVILVVNDDLKKWSETILKHKKVYYLPNFTFSNNFLAFTELSFKYSKKILCLANLRFQKNHELLLKVASVIKNKYPHWTFHLVGDNKNDGYAENIKQMIKTNQLENNVFIYGSKQDIDNIIIQSDICVLTSRIEGLPVSLIEYGKNKKPVVCTAVGEIPNIINNQNGFIVPSDDVDAFVNALVSLIENPELRKTMGENLYKTIQNDFSAEIIIEKYLDILK